MLHSDPGLVPWLVNELLLQTKVSPKSGKTMSKIGKDSLKLHPLHVSQRLVSAHAYKDKLWFALTSELGLSPLKTKHRLSFISSSSSSFLFQIRWR